MNSRITVETPECEKLHAVQTEWNIIAEFIDNLPCELQFAQYETWKGYSEEQFVSSRRTHQDILAAYFDIDMVKVEQERRALLDAWRELNP